MVKFMKIERPLINPSPDDFNNEDYKIEQIDQIAFEEEQEVEPEPLVEHSQDQLNLDIDTPRITFLQRINAFRMYLKRRNEFLEISTLWKSPALPFAIVSTIFNLILMFIGTIFKFDSISPTIPLFYNSIDKRWEGIDKIVIPFIILYLLIVENLIIYFIIKTFKNDKRLALTVSWILFILNILILIAIILMSSLFIPKS